MKVIIAGSRTITDPKLVKNAIMMSNFDITEVVCGCAEGVDALGEAWAIYNELPVMRFPSRWRQFGRSAGPIRNAEMAKYADALICVWDGVSKGSRNMIREARKIGIPVYEIVV